MSVLYALEQFTAVSGPIASSAICSALVMPLIIRARSSHNGRKGTNPQDIHIEPTSRLGGAAVFLAYVVAVAIALKLEHISVRVALPLLLSALPVLVAGLWEDIAHRASPVLRLFAAVASAALASAFSQGIIMRLDLPQVDSWLAFLPFAVPLTWFMVAGACNAINIIDGTHGLAGGAALLIFVGIALVAGNVGDLLILAQAAAMIGALTGFLLWNYPRGKVFLGDAGAYFIGFMYAQLSIQLIARNAGVSAWFAIALAAYPIVETLFSMYRRKIGRRSASMQPDALHLHSLLYLRFLGSAGKPPTGERRFPDGGKGYSGGERRRPLHRVNARVAPRLWLHVALCLATALIFYDNTAALMGFTIIYAIFYILCYRKAARLTTSPERAENRGANQLGLATFLFARVRASRTRSRVTNGKS